MDKEIESRVTKAITDFLKAGRELSKLWEQDDDVRSALNNGLYPDVPSFDELIADFCLWAQDYNRKIDILMELSEEVYIPYSWIKRTIGWCEFAEKTNRNVYAQKEYGFSDKEMFTVTLGQAKDLGYIK